MTDTDDTPEESNENDQISQEKNARLDRERTTLLSHLTEFKLEDMGTKVAFILNQYSSTRDSDTALTIKYWEVFHPDLIGNDAVSFENLYKFLSLIRFRELVPKFKTNTAFIKLVKLLRSDVPS